MFLFLSFKAYPSASAYTNPRTHKVLYLLVVTEKRHLGKIYFGYFDFTIEYRHVPRMVIDEPKMPNGEIGFLNTITVAMITNTRFKVLATAIVIGCTRPSAMNATSFQR